MDTPIPVQQPPTVIPQKSSSPTVLFMVGIALLVTAVIYLGYQNWQLRQQVTMLRSQPTPSPIAEATPSPDLTANWKTYTNTKYGFSFKYPSELSPEQTFEPDKSPSIVISGNLNKSKPNSHFSMVVGYTWGVSMDATGWDAFKSCATDDECYKAKLEEYNKFSANNPKEVSAIIMNKKVRGLETVDNNQQGRTFPLSKNGKFFSISYGFVNYSQAEIDNTQPLVDQILSTFKFLDQSVDTSSWKIYSALGFPIKFSYPTTLQAAGNYNSSGQFFQAFIDQKAISIPDVRDSPIAPIEIIFYAKGASGFQTYNDKIKLAESNLTKQSLREEPLNFNGINGVYISGITVQGYLGDEPMSFAIIDTAQGPVEFSLFGKMVEGTFRYISEDTFRNVVDTITLQK